MGEIPVIVSRGKDSELRVFLNVCPHRAMRLCSEDAGNNSVFRCPYHGFTFVNDGRLSGAPFRKDAYPGGLDRERLHLTEARVARYRGLIFATWDENAPPLEDFLGNLRWYLDIMVGRAEMEVIGTPQRFVVPSAWKVAAENFVADAHHTATVHAFLAKLDLVDSFDFGKDGYHVVPAGRARARDRDPGRGPLVSGRAARGDRAAPRTRAGQAAGPGEELPRQRLSQLRLPDPQRHRDQRAAGDGNHDQAVAAAGADRIRLYSWLLVERNAPQWWKDLVRRAHIMTFGASGMLEQDDTEIWEAVTDSAKKLLVRDEPWFLDYTMGDGKEPLDDFPGPGTVYEGKFSEASARGFYRKWMQDLTRLQRRVRHPTAPQHECGHPGDRDSPPTPRRGGRSRRAGAVADPVGGTLPVHRGRAAGRQALPRLALAACRRPDLPRAGADVAPLRRAYRRRAHVLVRRGPSATLELRVRRLETDVNWAEEPPSRTRRLVTNVRVRSGAGRRLGRGAQQPALLPQPW